MTKRTVGMETSAGSPLGGVVGPPGAPSVSTVRFDSWPCDLCGDVTRVLRINIGRKLCCIACFFGPLKAPWAATYISNHDAAWSAVRAHQEASRVPVLRQERSL